MTLFWDLLRFSTDPRNEGVVQDLFNIVSVELRPSWASVFEALLICRRPVADAVIGEPPGPHLPEPPRRDFPSMLGAAAWSEAKGAALWGG